MSLRVSVSVHVPLCMCLETGRERSPNIFLWGEERERSICIHISLPQPLLPCSNAHETRCSVQRMVSAKGMYLHTHTHTHTHIHAYACACMQKQGFRCNGWSRHKASRWCARQRSMLLETARYSSTCRYLNPEPEMSLATARCFSTCRCLNPKPKP